MFGFYGFCIECTLRAVQNFTIIADSIFDEVGCRCDEFCTSNNLPCSASNQACEKAKFNYKSYMKVCYSYRDTERVKVTKYLKLETRQNVMSF